MNSKVFFLVLCCSIISHLHQQLQSEALIFSEKVTPKDIRANLPELNPKDPGNATSIFDFFARDIEGVPVNLSEYKGNVTIIMNIAG